MSDPPGQSAWDPLTTTDLHILALENSQGDPATPLVAVLFDYLTMLEDTPTIEPALHRAFCTHWSHYAADIDRLAAALAAMEATRDEHDTVTPSPEGVDDLVAFGNRLFQDLLRRKQNDPS